VRCVGAKSFLKALISNDLNLKRRKRKYDPRGEGMILGVKPGISLTNRTDRTGERGQKQGAGNREQEVPELWSLFIGLLCAKGG
jgi:hypothetical protein